MRLLWELNQLCPYKYNDIKTWFVYVGGVMSGRGAGSGVGKYLYNYCTLYNPKSPKHRRLFWCVRTWPYRSKAWTFSVIKPALFQGLIHQKSRLRAAKRACISITKTIHFAHLVILFNIYLCVLKIKNRHIPMIYPLQSCRFFYKGMQIIFGTVGGGGEDWAQKILHGELGTA